MNKEKLFKVLQKETKTYSLTFLKNVYSIFVERLVLLIAFISTFKMDSFSVNFMVG